MKAINNVLVNTYKDIPVLTHLRKLPHASKFIDQMSRSEVDPFGVRTDLTVV